MGDFWLQLPSFPQLIGSSGETVTWWQMSIRGVLLFLWALILIRTGGRRAFGRNAAFDIVLAVIIGSNISRAVTGNAAFVPTAITCAVLVLLHAGITRLTYHSTFWGKLFKGRRTHLVHDGELDWHAMRRVGITERDLREAARLQGVDEIRQIRDAYMERNGDISVITG